jgi:copper(I)-binding protein
MSAAAAPADPVSVDGAWARHSTRPHVMFVYLTVSLKKDTMDTLIGASSPLADKIDLLAPLTVHGRQELEPVLGIELESHAPTVLQPGGPHLILRGVRQRLRPGDSFVVTLRFTNSGERNIMVKLVEEPPGTGMPSVPPGVKLD